MYAFNYEVFFVEIMFILCVNSFYNIASDILIYFLFKIIIFISKVLPPHGAWVTETMSLAVLSAVCVMLFLTFP